ncbi:MAG: CRISPR-associated protein Cas6 [Candidatus Micrarchaeota archaeon]|nr:MAG: CRISPR-associated protein Cas6 [Candidatus Micrarchaeota archaeon]
MFPYSRIVVTFRALDPNFTSSNLFYNHNYPFYSTILSIIKSEDQELSKEIHENKYKRAFLFSNIIPTKRRNEFRIFITSQHKKIQQAIANGFSRLSTSRPLIIYYEGSQYLFSINNVNIQSFSISDKNNTYRFNFLSYFILRGEDGKPIEPKDDSEFSIYIKESLLRTVRSIGIKDEFDLRINGSCSFKKKLIKIKHEFYRAWSAASPKKTIEISGSELVAASALYLGIGDKTKMGFGMLGIEKGAIE